jgi:hypothetical protein
VLADTATRLPNGVMITVTGTRDAYQVRGSTLEGFGPVITVESYQNESRPVVPAPEAKPLSRAWQAAHLREVERLLRLAEASPLNDGRMSRALDVAAFYRNLAELAGPAERSDRLAAARAEALAYHRDHPGFKITTAAMAFGICPDLACRLARRMLEQM